jgi:gamma-aminobutyric acid type B receptor
MSTFSRQTFWQFGVTHTYAVAILQLSYADTHPMFTKQHFPNFFRVVPSENAFNAPRLKLLREFNWTRVGTIYQNEPRYSLVSRDIMAA